MTLHEAVDAAFGAMQCRDAACANCGECRDSFHKALDRLLPAAPPSGEAPGSFDDMFDEAMRDAEINLGWRGRVLIVVHRALRWAGEQKPGSVGGRMASPADSAVPSSSPIAPTPAPRLSGEPLTLAELRDIVAHTCYVPTGSIPQPIVIWELPEPTLPAILKRLNALLGSAPQKEQVDSVTSPKDGPP